MLGRKRRFRRRSQTATDAGCHRASQLRHSRNHEVRRDSFGPAGRVGPCCPSPDGEIVGAQCRHARGPQQRRSTSVILAKRSPRAPPAGPKTSPQRYICTTGAAEQHSLQKAHRTHIRGPSGVAAPRVARRLESTPQASHAKIAHKPNRDAPSPHLWLQKRTTASHATTRQTTHQ